MTRATYGNLEVRPVPSALRRTTLALVLHDVPADRRAAHIDGLLDATCADQINLDGLLLAQRESEIVGAIWAYLQPGHVASIWPPVTRGPDADVAADALLVETIGRLAREGARLVQALVAVDAAEQVALLKRHGFAHMADLLYMVSLADQFPTSAPRSPLRLEPAPATDPSRLAALVDRTYEGTLDCPQLNGVRDVHDVLSGYRSCGVFDPARWLIARHDERDVGCLLLADHPAENQWEIVYAGLVPEARGHGYGLALARTAQWLTRRAGRARLVLAVDAANAPAVKVYESSGFVIWGSASGAVTRFSARGGRIVRVCRRPARGRRGQLAGKKSMSKIRAESRRAASAVGQHTCAREKFLTRGAPARVDNLSTQSLARAELFLRGKLPTHTAIFPPRTKASTDVDCRAAKSL